MKSSVQSSLGAVGNLQFFQKKSFRDPRADEVGQRRFLLAEHARSSLEEPVGKSPVMGAPSDVGA